MNMPPPAIIMSALPKRSRCSSQSSDAGRWYANILLSAGSRAFNLLVALRIGLVVDGGSDDHGECDEDEWISSSTSPLPVGAGAAGTSRRSCGMRNQTATIGHYNWRH